MSEDMLGERDDATVSGTDSDTSTKRFPRELICFRDTDEAVAVCGDCGRPVCGPALKASIRGFLSSITTDTGHARKFHDSTFHGYRIGLLRLFVSVILVGIGIVFSVIAPDALSTLAMEALSRSIGLTAGVGHAALILGVAGLLTLRYQLGESTTSLRLRVRKTAWRTVCDRCFENHLVQLVLTYTLLTISVGLLAFGVWRIVSLESAVPLRIVALGVAVGVVRDDLVAYIVAILEGGNQSGPATRESTPSEGPTGDDSDGPKIEMDAESPSVSGSGTTKD